MPCSNFNDVKCARTGIAFSHEITTTIARLRTKHFKEMKIPPIAQEHMWSTNTARTGAHHYFLNTFLGALPLFAPSSIVILIATWTSYKQIRWKTLPSQ